MWCICICSVWNGFFLTKGWWPSNTYWPEHTVFHLPNQNQGLFGSEEWPSGLGVRIKDNHLLKKSKIDKCQSMSIISIRFLSCQRGQTEMDRGEAVDVSVAGSCKSRGRPQRRVGCRGRGREVGQRTGWDQGNSQEEMKKIPCQCSNCQ